MNPYSETFANVASEVIRPMFGPSGVSTGHILRSELRERLEPQIPLFL